MITYNAIRERYWILPLLVVWAMVIFVSPSYAQNIVPGSISGDFSVNQTGSATYSVPVKIPLGTGGMQPSIALQYSSSGGQSEVGYGWAISGYSEIKRGKRKIDVDGTAAGMQFNKHDALYLDGKRLVPVRQIADDQIEYKTIVNDYSRIIGYGITDYGPTRFVVKTKAGLTIEFGSSENSRLDVNKIPIIWSQDRVIDTLRNYILFEYVNNGNGHKYIKQISYTGNQNKDLNGQPLLLPYTFVEFIYGDLGDSSNYYPSTYFRYGQKFIQNKQLTSIRVKSHGQTYRQYTFTHSDGSVDQEFRISKITETGRGGIRYRPTRFSYSQNNKVNAWMSDAGYTANLPEFSQSKDFSSDAYRVVDINSDGYPELLHSELSGGEIEGYYLQGTHEKWEKVSGAEIPFSLSRTDKVLFEDLNGDNVLEALNLQSSRKEIYSLGKSGWKKDPDLNPIPLFSSIEQLFFMDANGDDLKDLLVYNSSDEQTQVYLNSESGWSVSDEHRISGGNIRILDTNCDGVDELVTWKIAESGIEFSVYEPGENSWRVVSDLNRTRIELIGATEVSFEHINNDSCLDLLVFSEEVGENAEDKVNQANIVLATDSGWEVMRSDSNTFPLKDPQGLDVSTFLEFAQLEDGNSYNEIILHKTSGVSESYFFSDGEWKDLKFDFTPKLSGVSGRANFEITDLNNDGLDDLIYISAANASRPNLVAYVNTGASWVPSEDKRVPPVHLAQWKKFEQNNMFVDLNGDGLLDLIDHEKAWINTGSGWRESKPKADGSGKQRYIAPIALKAGDGGDNGVRLSDLNGDGRTDFIYSIKKKDGSISYGVFLNDPVAKDWVKTDVFDDVLKAYPFAHETNGWLGTSIIDLNGDGLPDLFKSYRSSLRNSAQKIFLNVGGSWKEEESYKPCSNGYCVDFAYMSAADPKYKPEVIKFPRRRLGGVIYPSHEISIKEPYPVNKSTGVNFTDLNGDGLPDILFYHRLINMPVSSGSKDVKSRSDAEKGALINTGSGWIRDDSYAAKLKHRLDENPEGISNPDKNYQSNYYVDINSDQLLDIVVLEKNGSNKTPTVYLNTGAGFTTDSQLWMIPTELFMEKTEATGFQFMDLNHDGRVDILQHLQDKNGNTKKSNAWINSGRGFDANENYKSPIPLGIETQGDVGFRFMDLNGDGFDDLLQNFKNKSGTISKGVWLNQSKRPNLIEKVIDGLGNEIFVNYNSMISGEGQTGPPGYFRDPEKSSYPEVWAMAPRYLVESSGLRIPGYNGSTKVDYKYGGFKINLRTGEPLGFEIRQELNRQQGTIHTEFYHQSGWLAGKTRRTTDEYINESGQQVLLSDKRLNWTSPVARMGEVIFGKAFAYWHNQLTGAETQKYNDTGSKSASKSEKIVYAIETGDVVKTEVSIADKKTTVTQNEYLTPDTTNWILGRLRKSTVTISRPEEAPQFTGDTETKSSCFEYDSKTGLLTKEVAYCGHDLATTTEYSYDSFGNKVRTVLSGNDFEPRKSSVVYDDKTHRLVVWSSNALNWESATEYDEVTLTAISTTDANGLTTRFQYDGFGTLLSTTDPLGVVSKTALKFFQGDDPRGSQISHYSETQTGDFPPDFSYFDAANREIVSKSTGFKGRIVRIEREYNIKGQLVAESTPFFEDDSSKKFWSYVRYDRLGRVVERVAPDNSTTKIVHDGRRTTTIDAEGRTKSVTVDNNEKPLVITDAFGGKLRYEYDVADRLVKTVNVDGSIIRHTYNDLGQKIQTEDPALGVWVYRYNSLGELLEQTDAKKQKTLIEYDILGRVVSKSIYDAGGKLYQTSNWLYDTAKLGGTDKPNLGALAKVDNGFDYSEDYQYDEFGRPIATSVNVNNFFITDAPPSYATSVEIDRYGRAIKLTYPTGFTVENIYDQFGFQTAVKNADTQETYWEAIEYDYAGRLIREKYGNGITQNQEFDDKSGVLSRKYSNGSPDGVVTDQAYEYDLVGNLLRKSDRPRQKTYRYAYDDLDRLNRVSISGEEDSLISYSQNGSILSKTGVGEYQYASMLPVGAIAALITPDGQKRSFSYDANGNMTESHKGRIEYTPENLVRSIRKSNRKRSSFMYTPGGNRYYHDYYDDRKHTRTLYAGLYERIYEQGVPPFFPTQERIRHRHYITSPGGTVGIVEDIVSLYPKRRSLNFQRRSTTNKPDFTSETHRRVQYFHTDHLGSITAITSGVGVILERMEYDAWGKRIKKPQSSFMTYRRGFTGHEHLDNLELIHMNGRVYDPDLGRFLSADPFIQNPTDAQNYNRYSYVSNNPLKYVDPTGFFSLNPFKAAKKLWNAGKRAVKKIGKEIGRGLKKIGGFLEDNWREIVVTAVHIGVQFVASFFVGPVAAGMIAGFVSGGLNAALYGGDFSDIMEAAVQGAAIGGFTAGATSAWGNTAHSWGLAEGSVGRAAGHGVIGGTVAELQGGEFMQGFGSASFTHLAAPATNLVEGFEGQEIARISIDATIGGTASVIGGGKFANGAITAAMQSQFNREVDRKRQYERSLMEEVALMVPEEFLDGFQGFADSFTFGATYQLREYLGNNGGIDFNSSSYALGYVGGIAAQSGVAWARYSKFANSAGGTSAWLRIGPSKLNGRHTYGVQWGSIKSAQRSKNIPMHLRPLNTRWRRYRLRGTSKPGHLHIWTGKHVK